MSRQRRQCGVPSLAAQSLCVRGLPPKSEKTMTAFETAVSSKAASGQRGPSLYDSVSARASRRRTAGKMPVAPVQACEPSVAAREPWLANRDTRTISLAGPRHARHLLYTIR